MDKRLTLDEAWIECLKMWRYVADKKRKDFNLNTWNLKEVWRKKQHYAKDELANNCFFCEYQEQQNKSQENYPGTCTFCPGRLLDESFSCHNEPNYGRDPIGFYNLLRRMQYKRLKQRQRVK